MSKTRARERKKKRLAALHAAKAAPAPAHETGTDAIPEGISDQKHKPGKFDARLNTGGKGGGKNIPNLAVSSRGAARSG